MTAAVITADSITAKPNAKHTHAQSTERFMSVVATCTPQTEIEIGTGITSSLKMWAVTYSVVFTIIGRFKLHYLLLLVVVITIYKYY